MMATARPISTASTTRAWSSPRRLRHDGTLWVEQPIYTQLTFALDRVRALAPQHPEWANQEPCRSVLAGDMAAVAAAGEHGMARIVAATHTGMSHEAFRQIAADWLTSSASSLAALRSSCARTYGVPPEQVVGTTFKLRYGNGDLTILPEIDLIDDGPGKPAGISRAFGRRPVAAFGNSDGDYEMLEYTTTGPGRRLGLIVHHDDAGREYAYDRQSHVGKLDRALNDAQRQGWLVASMRDDWTRVFPGG